MLAHEAATSRELQPEAFSLSPSRGVDALVALFAWNACAVLLLAFRSPSASHAVKRMLQLWLVVQLLMAVMRLRSSLLDFHHAFPSGTEAGDQPSEDEAYANHLTDTFAATGFLLASTLSLAVLGNEWQRCWFGCTEIARSQ